jgi:hypothetical protein
MLVISISVVASVVHSRARGLTLDRRHIAIDYRVTTPGDRQSILCEIYLEDTPSKGGAILWHIKHVDH